MTQRRQPKHASAINDSTPRDKIILTPENKKKLIESYVYAKNMDSLLEQIPSSTAILPRHSSKLDCSEKNLILR